MGITYSEVESNTEYNPEVGYRSLKIKEINSNHHKSRLAYIIGDGKLLKFDTKTWSLS
jgi:hypothetical protein